MARDAQVYLCLLGKQGRYWVYLVLDPDYELPDKVPGKLGKLDPIIVDLGELNNSRYGHQN